MEAANVAVVPVQKGSALIQSGDCECITLHIREKKMK